MRLDDVVRKEVDTKDWKKKPELVGRVLVHLNVLHRDAVQRMLAYEAQIKEAGGEPEVEVTVVFPEPIEEKKPPEEVL